MKLKVARWYGLGEGQGYGSSIFCPQLAIHETRWMGQREEIHQRKKNWRNSQKREKTLFCWMGKLPWRQVYEWKDYHINRVLCNKYKDDLSETILSNNIWFSFVNLNNFTPNFTFRSVERIICLVYPIIAILIYCFLRQGDNICPIKLPLYQTYLAFSS